MQNIQFERSSYIQQKVVLLCSIIFILCGSTVSYAQSNSATLRGTVSDENNAALPRVEITITNYDNQSKRTVHTNGSGGYSAPGLPPGNYRIIAQADGFAPKEIQDIVLNTSDQRRLDIQLKVNGAVASVTVAADSAINDDSAISTTFDRKMVEEMPLNGRTLQSMLFMTPGVVVTGANGDISVNGQRTNENYYTIDGVSANVNVSIDRNNPAGFLSGSQLGTNVFGGTNSMVSVEELEEIKIQTANYSPAFGRLTGAQVQLRTKSGGNQYHGSLYEYFRNEILDANDWTYNRNNRPRPPLRLNQFGGTFGGPLHIPTLGLGGRRFINGKDRTFFFINIEGMRMLLPQSLIELPAPLPKFREQVSNPQLKGLIDSLPVPTKPAIDVFTGKPSEVVGLYPFSSSILNDMEKYSVKINHNFTSNHSAYVRFNKSPSKNSTYLGVQETNGWTNVNTTTISYQTVLSPQIHNEVNFNYTTNDGRSDNQVVFTGGGVPFDLRTLAPEAPERALIRINLPLEIYSTPFSQGSYLTNQQKQYNVTDNFSWIIGNHGLKFGGDFRRMSPRYSHREYDLNYSIRNRNTVLAGKYDILDLSSRNEVLLRYDNLSAYAQDSWRINNRLGLDYGLRWDVNPAPRGTNVPLYTVTGFPDIANLALAPAGAPLYPTRYDGFSPSIGFSYMLINSSNWETVLRGGYRIVNSIGSGAMGNAAEQFPHSGTKSLPGGSFPAKSSDLTPATFPSLIPPYKSARLSLVAPDYALPRTHSWNLGIQQSIGQSQVLTISYIGNKGRRLLKRYTLTLPSVQSNGTMSRPYNPSFPGAVLYISRNDKHYGDLSDYNSLQVAFDRRLSRGLQIMTNYTWAHAISTGDTDLGTDTLSIGAPIKLQRIDSNFDRRHVFGSLVTYELPSFRLENTASQLINKMLIQGWALSGSYRYQSGTPITIRYAAYPPDGSPLAYYRVDRVPGEPSFISDPTASGGRRLNSKAFTLPDAVLNGSEPGPSNGKLNPNVERNNGIFQFDISLKRTFSIREKLQLHFRSEIFNVLNHPLFAPPNTSLGTLSYILKGGKNVPAFSPNLAFGNSTATLARSGTTGGLSPLFTIGGPRSIQLSIKLEF